METIFALGSNGSGQLGIGHREDVSVPKPALVGHGGEEGPARLPPIAGFAAGGNHTLLLASTGDLYTAGDLTTGACGLRQSDLAAAAGRCILHKVTLQDVCGDGGGGAAGRQPPKPKSIRLVAALWEASIIAGIDEEGRQSRVYSFGCGSKGELGQGPLIVRLGTPELIPNFPPPGTEVINLAAGMSHAVAVLSNGDVYGWGQGRKGQLGGPEGIVNEPRRIEGVGFKVAKAVCGKDFTVLVGERATGDIVVLGSDKWGLKTAAPKSVPDWKDVQASWGGVYVLRMDGSLIGWGRNDHNQLPASITPKFAQIAVGSEHVVALTEARDTVIAWGWGEHGNCGPTRRVSDEQREPWNVIASSRYMPSGCRFTAVAAGCATSWVMIREPTS